MSGNDSVTLVVGSARIEVPAHEIVQSILNKLIPASVERTAHTSNRPPAVGQPWPEQGGIYAGAMRGENGASDYHLIVPTDPAAFIEKITWGSRGKDEPGAQSTFDGLANTKALCASKHDHPAAQWAAGLRINGFDDFYLPSRREIRLCWVNVPELFAEGWHWSSTQYSAFVAWYQYFDDGGQFTGSKYHELRARAVRRLLVIQ